MKILTSVHKLFILPKIPSVWRVHFWKCPWWGKLAGAWIKWLYCLLNYGMAVWPPLIFSWASRAATHYLFSGDGPRWLFSRGVDVWPTPIFSWATHCFLDLHSSLLLGWLCGHPWLSSRVTATPLAIRRDQDSFHFFKKKILSNWGIFGWINSSCVHVIGTCELKLFIQTHSQMI
jgi:hypothetical protein